VTGPGFTGFFHPGRNFEREYLQFGMTKIKIYWTIGKPLILSIQPPFQMLKTNVFNLPKYFFHTYSTASPGRNFEREYLQFGMTKIKIYWTIGKPLIFSIQPPFQMLKTNVFNLPKKNFHACSSTTPWECQGAEQFGLPPTSQ
jgi:hypothetical protein